MQELPGHLGILSYLVGTKMHDLSLNNRGYGSLYTCIAISLPFFLSSPLSLLPILCWLVNLYCSKLLRLPSIGMENSPNTQQDSNPPLDFFAFDLSLSYSCCFTPEATASLMLGADLETILFISNVFRFLTSNRSNQKEETVPLQEKSCRYFFPLF